LTDSDLPDKPAKGLESIMGSFSGVELKTKLYVAGRHYASKGLDANKEFILNAPPGSVGRDAIRGAVQGVKVEDAPELFDFLAQNESEIGGSVELAQHEMIAGWANEDFGGAWEFLLQRGTDEERKDWLRSALFAGKPEEMIPKVWALEDLSLRQYLLATPGSIKAHINAGRFEILEAIDGQLEDRRVSHALLVTVDSSSDTSAAITAMREPKTNSKVLIEAVSRWTSRDMNAALKYLGSIEDPVLTSSVIELTYKTIAKFDHPAAVEWANEIQDPERKEAVLKELNNNSE
jgi:hypothetical protein